MDPLGGVKIVSYWDDNKLLTVVIRGDCNMTSSKPYNSYLKLEEDALKHDFTIYGKFDEYSNRFVSILNSDGEYLCGLVYYDCGIDFDVLLTDEGHKMLIGCEQKVIGLDCATKRELIQQDIMSLFYEFIEQGNLVIAFCELDLYVYDQKCNLVWSTGFRDVVEDYDVLNSETIVIHCANGDIGRYDLKSGVSV